MKESPGLSSARINENLMQRRLGFYFELCAFRIIVVMAVCVCCLGLDYQRMTPTEEYQDSILRPALEQ